MTVRGARRDHEPAGDSGVASRRRWVALVACGALPWTAILIGSELTLLFPFGVFNSNPPVLTDLLTLLGYGWRLPRNPQLLVSSYSFYALAVGSATIGVLRPALEPVRLTAGLGLLAALTHLAIVPSVAYRLAWTPFPVGSVVLLGVLWWFYGEALARLVAPHADD